MANQKILKASKEKKYIIYKEEKHHVDFKFISNIGYKKILEKYFLSIEIK